MVLTVLRTRSCGHGPLAAARARELVRRLGLAVEVEERIVATAAEAAARRFLGSPTLQIDGRDIEPRARDAREFGLG